MIARLNHSNVGQFIAAFSRDFYLDRRLVEDAVAKRSSFNIIHLASSFKIDFFVLQGSRYKEEEFSRRMLRAVDPEKNFIVYIQTPEDTLLSKLEWYRQGGEVSENQWRDVIGILKVQAEQLDTAYLQNWAEELGVSDLLTRAEREVRG